MKMARRSTVTASNCCPKAKALWDLAVDNVLLTWPDPTRPISSCRFPSPDLTWPSRERPIVVSSYDNCRRTTKRSVDDWLMPEHTVSLTVPMSNFAFLLGCQKTTRWYWIAISQYCHSGRRQNSKSNITLIPFINRKKKLSRLCCAWQYTAKIIMSHP